MLPSYQVNFCAIPESQKAKADQNEDC